MHEDGTMFIGHWKCHMVARQLICLLVYVDLGSKLEGCVVLKSWWMSFLLEQLYHLILINGRKVNEGKGPFPNPNIS